MSLYLSRVLTNSLSVQGMRLVESPERLHSFVCNLFVGDRVQSGFLFRLDTTEAGPAILIQSQMPPDLSRVSLQRDALVQPPETKSLDFEPSVRDQFLFRLLTRPVKRASTGTGNKAGARHDLRTDEERLAWIRRKGELSGFRVLTCGLTIISFPAVHSGGRLFRDKGGSFDAVRFDGELAVTDPDKLREAVASGIGTQKAFGFGLLSVAPVR